MKLRHQIFLISLCLLILPWGAWQYLKAVDLALRESQTQALIDNASLIADRLSLEPKLFDDFFVTSPAQKNDTAQSPASLYAFPLSVAPIVDGYGDEWRNDQLETIALKGEVSSAQLQVGAYKENFYVYLSVKDPYLQYYNPLIENNPFEKNSFENNSDDNGGQYVALEGHVSLTVFDGKGEQKHYFIRTSAPSRVIAHYYDDRGRLRRQDGIKGVWRENVGGYQLELAIDKKLLTQGFSLAVVDKQEEGFHVMALGEHRHYFTTPSAAIQQFIQVFHSPSFSVKIINPDQWLVATLNAQEADGQKTTTKKAKKIPWAVEWLYRQLLNSEKLLVRHANPYRSYAQYPEVAQSLTDGSSLQWYWRNDSRLQRQTLASVAVPIYHRVSSHSVQRLLGYVVLEKTTNQLIALTTSAFSQLFIYTIGTFLLLALILLLYASWLSFRISRLNQVANTIVNEKGTINDAGLSQHQWPDLHKRDELGDLSRGYRKLLLQVQEYNQYLRTLSSKLSHELRTPIAVVKSSLENMLEVDSPEAQHAYRQRAQQGVQRLNSLLTAMSSASSIEQSLGDVEFQEVDINDFLGVVCAAYQDAYPNHIIHYESNGEAVYGWVAQDLFVQMLDKLIDNAADFSPSDQAIIIRLRRNGEAIIIEVENSGSSLPDNMQHNLFESMVSVRDASSASHAHLGLGLYIVRLIVESHGGTVVAKNRSRDLGGDGVIFSICFPSAQKII